MTTRERTFPQISLQDSTSEKLSIPCRNRNFTKTPIYILQEYILKNSGKLKHSLTLYP
jgi:hypothetical protein